MKKRIALLLAAVMLLGLSACGGSAEPVEAAPATEPVAQVTEAPTEEPTVAPTEDPNAYTVYTLSADESYVDVVWRHGFWEVDMEACAAWAAEYGASGAQATPLSLELNQNGFRMEVDYTGFDFLSYGVIPYGTVVLLGTTAEGLENISGIDPADYQHTGSSTYESSDGVTSDFGSFAGGNLLEDIHWYFNLDEAGQFCDLTYVATSYYVTTGHLYNIIYRVPDGINDRDTPVLLYRVDSFNPYPPFHPVVQTLTYGDFTFEMSQFAIQCGNTRYVYDYRPGMSLSDWACSELNVDGWIPWYGDTVLSPDRLYIADTAYLDMREIMASTGNENLIVATENDGSINRHNNRSTYIDTSGLDLSGLDLSGNTGVTIMSGDALQEFMEQNGLNSMEEMQEYLQQNGTGSLPVTEVSPDPSTGSISTEDLLQAAAMSEEIEILNYGNISVSVAHMVNAKTPLFTPGFRVISKKDGRVAYHSVEMGGGHYLLDDTLDIYMNGIAEELIPHIKLYAFPESEKFMATLEGHTILNAHPTPLKQGDAMLTIPEDAVCLTFQRVPDGQEAPNSPSPLIVPNGTMHNGMLHGNLNKDAVYARYVTKDDPNFGEGVNLVFAITFDDELVYWIHMGAHFSESVDIEYVAPEMRY